MTATIYPATDRAWLDVDLEAVRHNVRQLRARAGVPLIVMVKANAYGVGAVMVSRALGVPFDRTPAAPDAPWGLGIASLDEAAELRDAGCRGRILCLTPLLPSELPRAHALGVRPALHRVTDIRAWAAAGQQGGERRPYHLSIDTGMARAGVRWDQVDELGDVLREHPPEGVFTHFHSADEDIDLRDEQDARFVDAMLALGDALPPNVLRHSDNSAGIAGRTRLSPGSLARPGIAVYAGMFSELLGLRPVVHLRARVIDIRDVAPGETVSYGATWTAARPSRIATISAGYADGYRRQLSNRGEVLIGGVRCPVAGRVTMDMIMVDVTDVPCAVGDVATLIGSDGTATVSAEQVAELADLSPYELLVGLALRVPARPLSLSPS
ncbi:alanine racemase [Gemmatimonas sp.]|uniref:alanine racemase n=1 Tax=Gemmatimonas sp. TaxID=1962908 RepID=UPI00286A473E|nr:alanine racemase [Gemmatimonas sp.]